MYSETTQRERKARIQHICDECKEPIAPKSVYIGNSAIVDGKYEPMRRHPDCIKAADILEAELRRPAHELRPYLIILRHQFTADKLEALLVDHPEVLKRLK